MPEDTQELATDETSNQIETSSSEGSDSFPDPEFDDVEQPEPSGEVPPADEAGGLTLPAESRPPPATIPVTPDPPPDDGGFTPYVPPREVSTPVQPQPVPQPQVKFFSVPQLQQGVDDGTITSNQMVEQLQLQTKEQAKTEALQAFRQESHNNDISRQLDAYRHAVPGWDQVGSQANLKAMPAYARLLKLNFPETDNTKLVALEQTFGTIARLQDARTTQKRTAASRDTVQEVGRRGPPPSSKARKDPLDILPKEEIKLYRDLIASGTSYKNWNEVRDELRGAAKQTSNTKLREAHAGLM